MIINEKDLRKLIRKTVNESLNAEMGDAPESSQSPMDELLAQIERNHPHIRGLRPDMKLGNPDMPYGSDTPFSLENYDSFVDDIIDVGSRRSGLDKSECSRRILGNEYSPEYGQGSGESYTPTLQDLLDRCFM